VGNHVHLLLETQGNLSKLMQAFQTSYTISFNKRHRRRGHVFEQSYKALLVDKDNYLLQVSRYIHLNPVSARMVTRPQDYRWSSYRSYMKGKGITGLKGEKVLGYLVGDRKRRLGPVSVSGLVYQSIALSRRPRLRSVVHHAAVPAVTQQASLLTLYR
jgi:putative transposase